LQQAKKYTLSKCDRLKSEKQIGNLFEEGRKISTGCLRMVYLTAEIQQPNKVQVMFSVPKRNFKRAVKRNLIKRRMKESYRLNKFQLTDNLIDNYLIAFIYTNTEILPYSEIEICIKELMQKFLKKVRLNKPI